MATNKELAEQVAKLKAEKAELVAEAETAPPLGTDLIAENEKLKEELKSKKEKEAELTATINDMENRDFTIVDGRVGNSSILVMTPDEYRAYSKEHGRVMGRPEGTKTRCTIEELRALINSKWTPSMVMEKHGLSKEDLKQLVWKLSQSELRDTPIKYSIERDNFDRGA